MGKKPRVMDIIIFGPIILYFVILLLFLLDHQNMPYENDWRAALGVFLGLLTIGGIYFSISYCIVMISTRTRFSERKKVAYGCLIMFFNILVIPYFYIKYIRNSRQPAVD